MGILSRKRGKGPSRWKGLRQTQSKEMEQKRSAIEAEEALDKRAAKAPVQYSLLIEEAKKRGKLKEALDAIESGKLKIKSAPKPNLVYRAVRNAPSIEKRGLDATMPPEWKELMKNKAIFVWAPEEIDRKFLVDLTGEDEFKKQKASGTPIVKNDIGLVIDRTATVDEQLRQKRKLKGQAEKEKKVEVMPHKKASSYALGQFGRDTQNRMSEVLRKAMERGEIDGYSVKPSGKVILFRDIVNKKEKEKALGKIGKNIRKHFIRTRQPGVMGLELEEIYKKGMRVAMDPEIYGSFIITDRGGKPIQRLEKENMAFLVKADMKGIDRKVRNDIKELVKSGRIKKEEAGYEARKLRMGLIKEDLSRKIEEEQMKLIMKKIEKQHLDELSRGEY